MFWDTALDDDLRIAAAFLRFEPGESGQAFGDGEYSFAARISGAPWHNDDDTSLVHLGVSYRHNEDVFDATNGLSGFQFRARPEIRNTPRFVDTQFIAADHTDLVGLEAAIVFGRMSIQGEYVGSFVHFKMQSLVRELLPTLTRMDTTSWRAAFSQASIAPTQRWLWSR